MKEALRIVKASEWAQEKTITIFFSGTKILVK